MRHHKTDFGFQKVSPEEKTRRVDEVFDAVAERYDVMNDLMSFGIHRLWKKHAVFLSGVKNNHWVLDIAGGTGDLAIALRRRVGETGCVFLVDINRSMLTQGRDKLLNLGIVDGVQYVQADVEALPFSDNTFDCVSIAFGLRNVTDKPKALSAMFKKLRYGGCLIILEFSKSVLGFLKPLYNAYSFNVIPKMGKLIAKNETGYKYLVESIRMHPDRKTLSELIENSGFSNVESFSLTGGIVAIHRAYKL